MAPGVEARPGSLTGTRDQTIKPKPHKQLSLNQNKAGQGFTQLIYNQFAMAKP